MVLFVTAADLVSAAWAVGSLPAAGRRIGGLQLRLVTNRGVAFGLGADRPGMVVIVGLLGTAALGWWLRRAATAGERVAVAVALGGALGNLLQRLTDGAVTDWIHLWPYPATFNLADVAVRAGLVVAVALRLLRQPGSLRTWARWLVGMRRGPDEARKSGGVPERRRAVTTGSSAQTWSQPGSPSCPDARVRHDPAAGSLTWPEESRTRDGSSAAADQSDGRNRLGRDGDPGRVPHVETGPLGP